MEYGSMVVEEPRQMEQAVKVEEFDSFAHTHKL